eukprot:UN04051
MIGIETQKLSPLFILFILSFLHDAGIDAYDSFLY